MDTTLGADEVDLLADAQVAAALLVELLQRMEPEIPKLRATLRKGRRSAGWKPKG